MMSEDTKVQVDPIQMKIQQAFPKVFDQFTTEDVVISDVGLKKYINLNTRGSAHTSGKLTRRQLGKANVSLVERMVNNIMRTEDFTGKKTKAYTAVKDAFLIINKKTKKNPLQILIQAIENSAPREEVTRLRFGGISVPKAVDISPSRRLDIALRNICTGAVKSSYKNKKTISDCLANEILVASRGELESFAVGKRDEIERVAASAR